MRVQCLGVVSMIALGAALAAQQPTPYTVKQAWVQADENYLAGDALRGRGSGTADEKKAADWVAGRFMEFGLVPAPGMSGYLQTAELNAPVLDGHATLTAGTTTLQEGSDFTLLVSSATDVSGKPAVGVRSEGGAPASYKGQVLIVPPGAAGQTSVQAASSFRRSGASLLIVQEDASTQALLTAYGGGPRLPVSLKGGEAQRSGTTLIAVKPAMLQQLTRLDGVPEITLHVHVVPPTHPRNTYNAIGYLKGTDPKAGTLLLTAHLDHLGVHTGAGGRETVYHGANDDAAGTTAVVELARALTAEPKPRRSVLFVCYGSEEIGELGSTYFGEHPPVPLKDLVANLEFEMIGAQDPKMPKGVLLLTGWERSNLGPELKAHGALLGPDPYPEQHFFERSDNYQLALDGVVAHTAAGWGTVPTYHQPTDDLAHLDVPFMTAAIQSLVTPVEWLLSSDFVPQWAPGGQPKKP